MNVLARPEKLDPNEWFEGVAKSFILLDSANFYSTATYIGHDMPLDKVYVFRYQARRSVMNRDVTGTCHFFFLKMAHLCKPSVVSKS